MRLLATISYHGNSFLFHWFCLRFFGVWCGFVSLVVYLLVGFVCLEVSWGEVLWCFGLSFLLLVGCLFYSCDQSLLIAVGSS